MDGVASAYTFQFEGLRLDSDGLFRLDQAGTAEPVVLGSRALDLLLLLVSHQRELISKDQIMASVWRGMVVEEANLAVQISALRRILDQNRDQGSCIQTVIGRGYRFVAPVIRIETTRQPMPPAFSGKFDGDAIDERREQGLSEQRREPPRLSILVLPFANLSNDPDQEYFADGITDDLTADLSRIPGSFVIARNTAFTFKDRPIDVKRIGRELGVRYVIEGSVRRAGDRVHINVQLIGAENGAHIWADRFEKSRADLSEAQSEIIGRLVRTLHVELVGAASRPIEGENATDPEASDLIMRGWARFWRGLPSAATAEETQRLFEQAEAIDPESADAKSGIAAALIFKITNALSEDPTRDGARLEQLVHDILERNPNHPYAHCGLGILRRVQNRLDDAKIQLEKAVALDGSNTFAFRNLGLTLSQMGRPEDAIPVFEKSISLSPYDPYIGNNFHGLGMCHLYLGHLDEAVGFLRRARVVDPRDFGKYLSLAGALGLRGDLDHARAEIAGALNLRPDVDSLAAWRACAPWITNPPVWALREKTVNLGLRRAGFPDE